MSLADWMAGAATKFSSQVAAAVESLGRRAVWVATDVLHGEQLQRLADTAMKKLGRIDILVNNAGGFAPQAALDTPVELFNQAMRFNVSTAYEMSILCVPLMVDSSGGGSIVNISSVAGEHPTPCFSSYGTAKGALSLLSRELAQEFAPRVRVNAIAVGSTRTDALNSVLNPEIEQTMVDLTPMARLGEVEDVALGADVGLDRDGRRNLVRRGGPGCREECGEREGRRAEDPTDASHGRILLSGYLARLRKYSSTRS